MELKGKITILFDYSGLKIEIYDEDASLMFCRVKLDQEQTCQALSRLANTPCNIEVYGTDKLGKKHEHESFSFPLGQVSLDARKETAIKIVKEVCPEGWKPDLYFSSQDSFFTKDNELWARCTIRRWVDK